MLFSWIDVPAREAFLHTSRVMQSADWVFDIEVNG
jgi:hypothetical protein